MKQGKDSASSTVADAALRAVAEQVHLIVPTIPGGYCMPLLAGAQRAGLQPLVCGSERGCMFVADGIAVATGSVVLVVLITGPGVAAALQGIYCARANRNPLVVLVGESQVDALGGAVQEGSGFAEPPILESLRLQTSYCFATSTPSQAVSAVTRAVQLARSTRRPAVVSIPFDVQRATWKESA